MGRADATSDVRECFSFLSCERGSELALVSAAANNGRGACLLAQGLVDGGGPSRPSGLRKSLDGRLGSSRWRCCLGRVRFLLAHHWGLLRPRGTGRDRGFGRAMQARAASLRLLSVVSCLIRSSAEAHSLLKGEENGLSLLFRPFRCSGWATGSWERFAHVSQVYGGRRPWKTTRRGRCCGKKRSRALSRREVGRQRAVPALMPAHLAGLM